MALWRPGLSATLAREMVYSGCTKGLYPIFREKIAGDAEPTLAQRVLAARFHPIPIPPILPHPTHPTPSHPPWSTLVHLGPLWSTLVHATLCPTLSHLIPSHLVSLPAARSCAPCWFIRSECTPPIRTPSHRTTAQRCPAMPSPPQPQASPFQCNITSAPPNPSITPPQRHRLLGIVWC